MHAALATLRDIDGVVGSFVIDGEGHVLGRDLPGMFDEDTLGYAGERLARLRHALEGERCNLDGGVARFGQHLLVMKAAAERTLCVIVPQGTNLMALQMGANIVARRVSHMPADNARPHDAAITAPGTTVSPVSAAPPPPPPTITSVAPTAPAASVAPASTPSSAPRMFRGRPI